MTQLVKTDAQFFYLMLSQSEILNSKMKKKLEDQDNLKHKPNEK